MKDKILILLVGILSLFGSTPVHAQALPIATFDKMTVDFGKFTEKNAKHQAVFTVKNTGKAPLIIVRVKASCGCTTPSYTKAPIMPGKTGTITVTYNGANRAAGAFNKTIVVTTNASKDQVRLHIKGEMQPSTR